MEALKSIKQYEFEEIIKVVKRENNKKRKFLFLNSLQAKYIPSSPRQTIDLFKALGEKVFSSCLGEKVAIIGFAETATAIGAVVAERFGSKGYYVHTTREVLEKGDLVAFFEEEHSHATSHYLYCDNEEYLRSSDVIVFIDDEFTTGKTICNFLDALKEKKVIRDNIKIVAASLVNCMLDSDINKFYEKGIDCEYLIRADKNWSNTIWSENKVKDIESENAKFPYEYKTVFGKIDSRKGTRIKEYINACEVLYTEIYSRCKIDKSQKEVLILGTEECMYPAISVASYLEKMYIDKKIYVHATSRSPIVPILEKEYPIYNRSRLKSFYDCNRDVFLYNLKKYDKVIIITDASTVTTKIMEEVVSILAQYNNKDITIVKWEE